VPVRWLVREPEGRRGLAVAWDHQNGAGEAAAKMAENLNEIMAEKITARDHATVARFFDGLELVEPGLVRVSDWRPPAGANAGFPAAIWAGAARK
jgi:hypothetical protein